MDLNGLTLVTVRLWLSINRRLSNYSCSQSFSYPALTYFHDLEHFIVIFKSTYTLKKIREKRLIGGWLIRLYSDISIPGKPHDWIRVNIFLFNQGCNQAVFVTWKSGQPHDKSGQVRDKIRPNYAFSWTCSWTCFSGLSLNYRAYVCTEPGRQMYKYTHGDNVLDYTKPLYYLTTVRTFVYKYSSCDKQRTNE
jgi:hypothetical protein